MYTAIVMWMARRLVRVGGGGGQGRTWWAGNLGNFLDPKIPFVININLWWVRNISTCYSTQHAYLVAQPTSLNRLAHSGEGRVSWQVKPFLHNPSWYYIPMWCMAYSKIMLKLKKFNDKQKYEF